MPGVEGAEQMKAAAERVAASLREQGVKLTMGGEPTYVPFVAEGAEWNTTAVGETKLRYAYRFADEIVREDLREALCFYSPGKSYPGEVNPRWTLQLVWNRDGTPIIRTAGQQLLSSPPALNTPLSPDTPTEEALGILRAKLSTKLKVGDRWLRALDPRLEHAAVWVLPLDHNGRKWESPQWLPEGGERALTLLGAEGPAGLRLPLYIVPEGVAKRAVVIERLADGVSVFIPPLLQPAFNSLMEALSAAFRASKVKWRLQGYVPSDAADRWEKLSIAPDPGVIEVNLPPCHDWSEYNEWIRLLDAAAARAGLCSYKQVSVEEVIGTGGGNHLLFGGPSAAENPFFTNPRWITSILRYWQHHPSLSYLFTGHYVGPSSQAPRPDESARAMYDLEMAYQFLEGLEPGDHRYIISETLRHLHTDGGGNTHRSEISFDKFWSVSWEGGCRGLIEFRAVESLPRADWTAAVGLLWQALAACLLKHPFCRPLTDFGLQLHDRYFLPAFLWDDFRRVLQDLRRHGFDLPEKTFRDIWSWRFPLMLQFRRGDAVMWVRKGHEGWPLLCETPIEGGTTSRFVDTSIERLEITANAAFADAFKIGVQGRSLDLSPFPRHLKGAGLRYRRSMLHPSLHPGMPPHMPLSLSIRAQKQRWDFRLDSGRRRFEPCTASPGRTRRPCRKLNPELLTFDLRIL